MSVESGLGPYAPEPEAVTEALGHLSRGLSWLGCLDGVGAGWRLFHKVDGKLGMTSTLRPQKVASRRGLQLEAGFGGMRQESQVQPGNRRREPRSNGIR